MANLDFYSTRNDQLKLLDFIFSELNFRVFQSYSDFDSEIEEYKSTIEIDDKYCVGIDKHGNGTHCLFQLWSPTIMDKLEINKINLDEKTGHTYRYNIEGFALVQLYLGGIHNNYISKSHIGSNSEARAKSWGYISGVNWENHKKEINKLCNYIRRDSKVKIKGRVVMQEALDFTRNNYLLKDYKSAPWHYRLNNDHNFEYESERVQK
ncbi:hypothetical protein [Paenibacillus sp. BC26]|uniref:hypothetical protein n=1 Tax=Paenibacillus sp. BC26 TaxID=1881032 RepID=UPI0008EF0DEA|nr:hypothetical protein [Paenibacillus sp. BC26]SFS73098.1 hypothetical protein SAMN05428962_2518 [Paenibacillus sp. BC26]